MRSTKRVRGINQVLAVVLLAVVTAAIIIGVYMYFSKYTGSKLANTQTAESPLAFESGYIDTTAGTKFVLYISNLGGKPVVVDRAYIKDPVSGAVLAFNSTYISVTDLAGNAVADNTLQPGEAYAITIDASAQIASPEPGAVYTVTIVTTDGSTVTASLRA